ncbi:MAG: class I SAM-dependent methyltransferase [Deltaproteobacteria bacterium]
MDDVLKQREYYTRTAAQYDAGCAFDPNDEHFIAAALLSGLIDHYRISSLLDVGCGTGRALLYLRERHPNLKLSGIEPVVALRDIAISKGLSSDIVHCGNACNMDYPDGHFDCVTAFGVLHHIPHPDIAIREMKRVARHVIYISDHNIYGMGSWISKTFKQCMRELGLRWLLKLLLTRGKGFHDTNWDGIFYPFSLLDHMRQIKLGMNQTFTFSTKGPAINLYRKASHIAVLGLK